LPATATPEQIAEVIRAGRYAEAESRARRLVAECETAQAPDALRVAVALDLLVEALWRGGKAQEPETLQSAERSLEIRENALGPDHQDVAKSVMNLGIVFKERGDRSRARPLYERALAIRERALGADHIEVADSLQGLAGLLMRMGEYDPARPLYERALAIREKALGPDHSDVASTLNSLALLMWNTGEYAEARPLFERALTIKSRVLGPEHPDVGRGMNNLALLLWNTGEYEGARLLYERALAILEKALGPEHPDVASNMNYLALLLRDTNHVPEARRYFERAGAILEKKLGDHPRVAENLHNRAALLRDTGDHAGARRLFERSLAILEKADGPEHPDVAKGLNGYALLLRATGDHQGARRLLERALAIRENALGPDHPAVAETLLDLATELAEGGDSGRALDLALRAEAISREHLRHTFRTFSERQALGYAAVRTSGLGLALSLAMRGVDPGRRGRAWDALVRSRALVLDEMAARQRSVHVAGDAEAARLAGDLDAARRRLAALVVRGPGAEPPARYRSLLDRRRADREKAELALAVRSADFRNEQERARVGLDDVRAALPRGSALLAYASFNPPETSAGPSGSARKTTSAGGSYLALVLSSHAKEPVLVPLGPREDIDSLVARWKDEIGSEPPVVLAARRSAEAAYRRAGQALRRRIWDPVAGHLKDARQVFIVPDGVLNLVSLSTLPVGESTLLERGPEMHYLSAERDLARATGETATRGKGLLVVGGPDFESGEGLLGDAGRTRSGDVLQVECPTFGSMRFAPLPGARLEADAVATLWRRKNPDGEQGAGEVLELTGVQAAEGAFRHSASGRRIVHLATHGFFLDDRCPSALARAGPIRMESGEALPPVTGDSPLLLAGLALAGANLRTSADDGDGGEDGILTAEEIASLDLWGVEWFVLSACQTGLGRIQSGEGVLGLRRAVQIAGARTLILSLWRVNDLAALAWMKELYQARLSGLSTSAAVREASLASLASRRRAGESTHPYYWGAFVATGDWR
jgi:CHAT domain-containing protein/Tfp pilus assembly protein PilF